MNYFHTKITNCLLVWNNMGFFQLRDILKLTNFTFDKKRKKHRVVEYFKGTIIAAYEEIQTLEKSLRQHFFALLQNT